MRRSLALLSLLPAAVAAQRAAPPTVPTNLTRADEIRYAQSAAPTDVSNGAKVWVLENGHYAVAVPGTSSMTCTVFRENPASFVPICGDSAAEATVFAIGRFETEARLAGKTHAEVMTEVAQGLASGRFRVPTSPALTYMTSSAQVITDTAGMHPTHWYPHLMVFYPNMHAKDLGIVASDAMDVPNLDDDGMPTSRLVIVVRDWTDPVMATAHR